MKKICVRCGTEFEAKKPNLTKTLCDSCAAQSANRTPVRDRVCIDCGAHFTGYARSLRCQSCNDVRKQELKRLQNQRRREGKTRKIGSTSHCEICGKEYVVNGGKQRYCPNCAQETIKAKDRQQAREWMAKNFDYEQRQKDRAKAIAQIPCVICGKTFTPHTRSLTCSSECMEVYKKQKYREWEIAHKEDRKLYQRDRNSKKIAAMTPEEYKQYRDRLNARARENYRKRKEANKEKG